MQVLRFLSNCHCQLFLKSFNSFVRTGSFFFFKCDPSIFLVLKLRRVLYGEMADMYLHSIQHAQISIRKNSIHENLHTILNLTDKFILLLSTKLWISIQ